MTNQEHDKMKSSAIEAAKLLTASFKDKEQRLIAASMVFSVIAQQYNIANLTVGDNSTGLMTYISNKAIQSNPELIDIIMSIAGILGEQPDIEAQEHTVERSSHSSVH